MSTKLVNGVRITLTQQEEDAFLIRSSIDEIQVKLDAVQNKKDMLIAYEKEQVIEALITGKLNSIEIMDEVSLNAALLVAGLR